MGEIRILETFAEGDSVPEWLIERSPLGPDSVLGRFVFNTDAAVLGTDVGYLVVPTARFDQPLLLVEGSQHLNIAAAAQATAFATAWNILTPGG